MNAVDNLILDEKEVSSPNVETNTTVREESEDIPIEGLIPIEDLIVLYGY